MDNQYGLTGSSAPGDNSPATDWEHIHSKRLLDSASRHVTDGRFEQARLQLEAAQRLCAGTKGLAELLAITEVCLAAVGRSCPCQSRRHKSPDWYHILKVDWKADINIIKKRYRQLALLLHPDKNTHVKAEWAFQYISQAYDCLSDNNKRITFNLERAKFFCRRCSVSNEARDSIPTVFDTVSRRSPRDPQGLVRSSGSCSGVYSPTELVCESARLQAIRTKARARGESAGSELGSRIWRWNKEFEKLNVRRDGTDYERRHILCIPRTHVNEARAGYTWRIKRWGPDPCAQIAKSQYQPDSTRQGDLRTMPGNDNVKQPEKPRVSKSLDDLHRSLKSETGGGRLLNSSTSKSAYPSFETGYFGSGFRQNLPTTAEIIKYFKDLSSAPPRPEPANDPKKLNNFSSLRELYFPKKSVDSCQEQEQSSGICRPVVPSTHRVNLLPEKDLSRLDSSSLLRNLDAALADIAGSAGRADCSSSNVPPLKDDRKCLKSSLESSSLSCKLSVSGKPPRKPVSHRRAQKVGTDNEDTYSHSANCVGQLSNFDYSLDGVAENLSMFITPLLRKRGVRTKIPDTASGTAETQSKNSYDSHSATREDLIAVAQHPVLRSEISLSRAGTLEAACQSKTTETFETPETTVSDDSSSPLPANPRKTSGLNPLLSSEKLGRWMDGLAASSNITSRRTQEDWKSRNLETPSSVREESNTASLRTEMGTWWGNEEKIPSYLPAKALGTSLPDYGKIWTEGNDYSTDDYKLKPPIVTSTTKSDFCCNPAISLASSTRSPISDFSCSLPVSLAPPNLMTSSSSSSSFRLSPDSSVPMTPPNSSCSPAVSYTRIPSSEVSCTHAVSLPSSTRLLESGDPPQSGGLRSLHTTRFHESASYADTQILGSGVSELAQQQNILKQVPSSTPNAGKYYDPNSGCCGTISNHFPLLSPRANKKLQVCIDSCKSELVEHCAHLHGVNKMDQSLDNSHLASILQSLIETNMLQKSDELLATLERLREEAKSISATLQNYIESSRIRKATITLSGVRNSDTTGLLSKCH